MRPKRSTTPKKFAATTLPDDLHDQLRWLAIDLGTSVSSLLRWGAMLVLESCGEELPQSVAPLRRVLFGGQAPRYAHETAPEVVRISFDDDRYAALKRLADRMELGTEGTPDDGVATVVHRLVTANIPPSLSDPEPIGSVLN